MNPQPLVNTSKFLVITLVAALLAVVPLGQPARASLNIVFADGICDLGTGNGTGTEADPYLISDAPSLWEISDCSSAGKHFRLTNDIDLAGVTDAPTSSPIGYTASGSVAFAGVLDGQNHSITGIEISSSTGFASSSGLIWKLNGATVRNITISGSVTYSGTDTSVNTGGLSGTQIGTSNTLANVTNEVDVIGLDNVGGFVGKAETSVYVSGAINKGQVSGSRDVGGIVGVVSNVNNNILSASDSVNTGNISGLDNTGGLVGFAATGNNKIERSTNSGQVIGRAYTGGLLGLIAFSSTLRQLHNSGEVTGTRAVGGLIGGRPSHVSGTTSVVRSTNGGGVTGTGEEVGGLIGSSTGPIEFDRTHNLGDVQGADIVGGLVGSSDATTLLILSSYNAGTISGTASANSTFVGGLAGYTSFDAEISSSFNIGPVKSTFGSAAGLTGHVEGRLFLENSFNTGPINTGVEASGLFAFVFDFFSSRVSNTYNSGAVTGGGDTDGLNRLYLDNPSSVYSSVASIHVATSTIQDMQSASLYTGWDFATTWGFGTCNDNNGLPLLRFANQVDTFYSTGCITPQPSNMVFANEVCDFQVGGYPGNGTIDDPYLIVDAESLWESPDCGSPGTHFKLLNDIDLRDATLAPTSSPIGYTVSGGVSFSGVLDGDNKSIANVAISSSVGFDELVGLFWKFGQATVKNLSVSGAVTYSGADSDVNTGGLVGKASAFTLSNVTSEIETSGHWRVGGIIGQVTGEANLYAVRNLGVVSGHLSTGGLIGVILGDASISSSSNLGTVTGTNNFTAGLVGQLTSGDVNIYSSSNNAAISGKNYVSGLVGQVFNGNATVRSSINHSLISGEKWVSGLVSSVERPVGLGAVLIESSINHGNLVGTEYLAGLLSYLTNGNVAVLSSENHGSISGGQWTSGLVGFVSNGSTNLSHSANLGDIIGTNFTAGLISSVVTGNVSVDLSRNTGSVSGSQNVGGLVGRVSPGIASLSASVNSGVILGNQNVGGIVGTGGGNVSLESIQNLGPVSSSDDNVGGLIGYASADLTITSSYNAGTITSPLARVGGLVGRADGAVSVATSFNQADISGGNYVGGLLGSLPSANHVVQVASSSNVGSVAGTGGNMGGLVGYIQSGTIDLDFSFNAGSVTGSYSVDGLVGLNSANVSTISAYSLVASNFVQESSLTQMQSASLYNGWDFTPTGTWGFGDCTENNGLPTLRFAGLFSAFYSEGCFTPPVQSQNQPGSQPVAPVESTPAVYSGPVVTSSPQKVAAGEIVTLSGANFSSVTRIVINGIAKEIVSLSETAITFRITESMRVGTYALEIISSFGTLTLADHIEVTPSRTTLESVRSELIGRTLMLPGRQVGKPGLTNLQSSWLNETLARSGLTRIVCTAIVTRDMTAHQRVQVRKLAKAACDEAAELLPGASVWHQSKFTTHTRFARKVALTFKG